MSWSAYIVDRTGETRNCAGCKHVAGCQVIHLVQQVASTLTSVDTCCDGHTAHGTARLECNGFEPIVTADGADDAGSSNAAEPDGDGG